jgi:hypothetical protein
MTKCYQCDRPAMFLAGAEHNIPLCLYCQAKLTEIGDIEIANAERQANAALADMEAVAGVRLGYRPYPERKPPVRIGSAVFHNINVKNSAVGIINTGNLDQVDTAITVISGNGDSQLAHVLKNLTEVIVSHPSLSPQVKKEAVEILSGLSSEASVAKSERRAGIARPLLSRLRELLSVSADLATVAQSAVPIIAAAFGLAAS